MPKVKQDIEVEAPVDRVYQFWTNYENFPSFMEHVKEVRRIGADRTHWRAEAAGTEVEWDAQTITEANRRVAWRATGESGQSGEVRFEPLGANRTRVQVEMDYTLDSKAKEAAASILQIDDKAVRDDLNNFKDLIEGRR